MPICPIAYIPLWRRTKIKRGGGVHCVVNLCQLLTSIGKCYQCEYVPPKQVTRTEYETQEYELKVSKETSTRTHTHAHARAHRGVARIGRGYVASKCANISANKLDPRQILGGRVPPSSSPPPPRDRRPCIMLLPGPGGGVRAIRTPRWICHWAHAHHKSYRGPTALEVS